MRVSLKILFVILVVAVLPVTVSGLTSVVLAKSAVAQASSEKLESEARHLAELSETTILGSLDDLRQSANLDSRVALQAGGPGRALGHLPR